MRQLLLLRHGHAVPNSVESDDVKRQLTPEGKKEAQHIAQCLVDAEFIPQRLIASPAVRTLKTAEIVSKTYSTMLKLPVEIQPTLYAATAADLLTFIETLPDECERALLVGHNPGISECAALLAKRALPPLTPAGACWLQWPQHDKWEDIANGNAMEVHLK